MTRKRNFKRDFWQKLDTSQKAQVVAWAIFITALILLELKAYVF